MSNLNILPSDDVTVVGVIDPDLNTAGTYTTAWVDMGIFQGLQSIILAGALGTGATLDAKLEQATDDSGTGVKDVPDKAITQLTEAGGDSDKQVIINCFPEELDINNDYSHVRLSVTIANASSDSCAVVLGHYARYQPQTAIASVAEVVN